MKDLRRILSRYTGWLLKKGIIDHPTAMIDYEIADQYLESEASRSVRKGAVGVVLEVVGESDAPNLLEKVIEYVEYAECRMEEEWGSGRSLKELMGDGDMPDIYDELLEIQAGNVKHNSNLKAVLLEIYDDAIMADEFGNDDNKRRETREKFDSIIGKIKML